MQLHSGLSARLPACALSIGNFDGVHRGHQAMLKRLRERATVLNVPTALLTFEPLPRELFMGVNAPPRLNRLRDRVLRLAATGAVDHLIVQRFDRAFAAQTAEAFIQQTLIERLNTRYVLVGDDFHFGAGRCGDFAQLAACSAFESEALSSVKLDGERISSSAVRLALQHGALSRAKRLLGDDYAMSGRVAHGKKLGRTLGFPTANIYLSGHQPALQGVFVVQADTAYGTLLGAASLGVNPTITRRENERPRYQLEVYFLDFSGDLYGHRITVRFLHKLRDELKFDSLEALVAQIERDVAQTRQFFTHSS